LLLPHVRRGRGRGFTGEPALQTTIPVTDGPALVDLGPALRSAGLRNPTGAHLTDRLGALEEEVRALRDEVAELMADLETFRRQFE
jgi:hypothetical protein